MPQPPMVEQYTPQPVSNPNIITLNGTVGNPPAAPHVLLALSLARSLVLCILPPSHADLGPDSTATNCGLVIVLVFGTTSTRTGPAGPVRGRPTAETGAKPELIHAADREYSPRIEHDRKPQLALQEVWRDRQHPGTHRHPLSRYAGA